MSLPELEPPVVYVRSDDSVPVLVIPAEVPFDALRAQVRATLPTLHTVIGGRSARLDLGARPIELFDLRRLISLLKEDAGITLTGLYARPDAITRFAERELKLKLFPTAEEPPEAEPPEPPEPEATDDEATDAPAGDTPSDETPQTEASNDEDDAPITLESADRVEATPSPPDEADASGSAPARRTLTVERTLRSGASIRYDGDVLVLGDVNPGAEIVATGNVMVLGALKGLAHAGSDGDADAFILSFDLRPTQVRIARRIAIPASRAQELRNEPEVARIVGEHVVIEPYRSRNR